MNKAACIWTKQTGFLLVLLWLAGGSVKCQTFSPGIASGITPFQSVIFPDHQQINASRSANQKWFVSRYAALSAGSVFYPGGSAIIVSAPIGLQLNRQLNNNLYAFGGVYVAPTFAAFNQTFLNQPNYPGNYPGQYSFGLQPGVQMGLMYINDAGTFSISGSIRAERSSYPAYPAPPPARQRK